MKFFVGVFAVLVMVASGLVAVAASDEAHPPHVAPPVAEVAIGASLEATGGLSPEGLVAAVTAWLEGEARAERERQEELERLAAEEAARMAAVVSHASRSVVVERAGACGSEWECFRDCTLRIESGGNYAINSGNGFYGAWQFLQSTWDSVAANAGYDAWVGQRASDAPPEVQDAVARFLWEHSGNRPWGGRC